MSAAIESVVLCNSFPPVHKVPRTHRCITRLEIDACGEEQRAFSPTYSSKCPIQKSLFRFLLDLSSPGPSTNSNEESGTKIPRDRNFNRKDSTPGSCGVEATFQA